MDPSLDVLQKIKHRKEQVFVEAPPIDNRQRLLAGLILGYVLSFVYGIVSQNINAWISPEIPFASSQLGQPMAILLLMGFGGFVGLLTTWPQSAITGAGLGAVLMVLFSNVRTLYEGNFPILGMASYAVLAPGALIISAFQFFFCLPVLLLLRGWVEDQHSHWGHPAWSWPRLRLALAAIGVVVCLGATSLYSPEVRQVMSGLNTIIKAGLNAAEVSELPVPLRPEHGVVDFLTFARPPYTLERGPQGLAYWIDPDATNQDIPIIARFNRGGLLVCVLRVDTFNPRCRSYIRR